ncbi:MAG: tetratricopeptide repeat protein, partial [Chitinivibrionales bacterium]|nr:tetratricopeptide repeat protein [Chitinivibrionales bacterium]MBD3355859.1 tetratricopeptide repeat protein [Chitinivibrionales bacterium]
MNMSFRFIASAIFLTVFSLHLCSPSCAAADDKAEELRRKIAELKRKKEELARKRQAKMEQKAPSGEALGVTIARYENLYDKCAGQKSDRCADVMYTLGRLYYEKAREDYIQARNDYEKAMDKWERSGVGTEPTNPVPDYSKALEMYRKSVEKYPNFEKADEGYYQLGNILLVSGELAKSREAFEQLLEKTPNSVRASAAHFRIADFCFIDRDYSCALRHIEKIDPSKVSLKVQEMAHYRKAEIYYNRAEFDKAAELFYEYVERCDAGQYVDKDLRDEALEYMAISFSDMPEGAQAAVNFFKKRGRKPYEDYLIYTVGMKNFDHGQYSQALTALKTALDTYPYYKAAPVAQQMVINCYVIRKKYEEANRARERLVDRYGAESEWASRNAKDKAALENAQTQVAKALAALPIYFHAEFQKTKKRDAAQKALERYEEYFEKFPNNKWKVYEFKYNVAEIHNTLGNYQKAAECYDYVAQADLSTYPKFVPDEIDTFALDQEEIERRRAERKKSSPVNISQEDAGYNAVVALDNLRKKVMAKEGLDDRQMYDRPETQKLLKYIVAFERRFPNNSNAPELLYLGGNIHYSAEKYQKAIAEFRKIVDMYPNHKITDKAQRMLANSYSASGEYHLALAQYRTLLADEKPGTPGYAEVLDLAAGALFKKANDMKKGGDFIGAAAEFKNVADEFPKSKVVDRAWFEAANTYEEANSFEEAAKTFVELGERFPKSKLREKAYVRAAEAYKKSGMMSEAAKVYELAATKITGADYAIPSLSMAAKAYEKAKEYGTAAKMSETIFSRFPKDKRAPQGLYEAGLMYEKAKRFEDAVRVYGVLAEKFPQSEYAAEGAYSIGFCYEKMNKKQEMANAFADFAQKFTENKSKQVMALVRAAEAYSDLNQMTQAQKYAETAANVYEQFKRKADIDLVAASKAYYMLGEIHQKVFNAITLRGRSEKQVQAKLKEKVKALEPVLKSYAKAIELGVA